jgi:hypothetical protein
MSLLESFVEVDDFCQEFEAWVARQQLPGRAKRGPAPSLSASEVMTILVHFHQANYRDFKHYYQKHVCNQLVSEFPGLISYGRFVELLPSVLLPLCAYLQRRFGSCSGIAFADSTDFAVCHNRRISRHKVFQGLAARGKSSMGWFYGFKLHLIVNEQGELLAVHLTPGNVDDRKPLPEMSRNLFGKLFADKGYLSRILFEQLFERGLELQVENPFRNDPRVPADFRPELITSLRKNMKGQLMLLSDRILLRKRFIIERSL